MERILVVGSSSMDLVLNVQEMPRSGETIHSLSYGQFPGGKGANQAYACGRLGGGCVFVSAIGDDEFGRELLASLHTAHINTDDIRKAADCSTGMAVILVDSQGENRIVIVPGANKACDSKYLKSKQHLIEGAGFVLAQLETPVSAVCQFLMEAKKRGCRTVLNPAPVLSAEELPDELYPCLDYITPNETELEKLTGCPVETEAEVRAAARTLLERGVEHVIVTTGARGAVLVDREEETRFEAVPAETVDTTAAGDTFNAGLVVALAEGKPLSQAIRFANAAASLSVRKRGAQPSVPLRTEVERLLARA